MATFRNSKAATPSRRSQNRPYTVNVSGEHLPQYSLRMSMCICCH